jgi:hypothetical protein
MVKSLLAGLLLCVATVTAWAEGGCTAGSEFEPRTCPLELPRITRITILRNAAKSIQETDPAVSCGGFKLTPTLVRRYLTHAKTVDANDAHHTLDWSPCSASGEVRFADGRRGRWHIEQLRAGTLKIGDADEQVVYCASCKFKPFQW